MPGAEASPATILDSLETLAFALVSLTSRALSERGSQWQLTFQQWRTLVVLGQTDRPMRISEIGRRIAASGPSASRIVQRLEDHGLVELLPDPRDGRAVGVRMTAAGAGVRAAVVERRRELIRELLGESADRPTSPEAARLVAALETAI